MYHEEKPFRVLFLDDDPERFGALSAAHPTWAIDWAQRVSAFLYLARNKHYDLIMLDHDLGYTETTFEEKEVTMRELTGLDAVRYLISNPGYSIRTKVHLHSHNFVGAQKMYDALKKSGLFPELEVKVFFA